MNLGLRDRVVLVTGSSRGIGRSIAMAFAAEGARVAVTYHSNRGGAESVANAIQSAGTEATIVRLDLNSVESVADAVGQVLALWGQIDVLVNNAIQWGAYRFADSPPFERLPREEWQRLLHANIEGAFAAHQAVLGSMRQRRWGRIVNMSTVFAEDGMAGAAWYASAKAALHGLTRSLAREVGAEGILINAVMPGLTLTDRAAKDISAEVRERNIQASPLGRLLSSEEIASVVVFLCSAANAAITGEIIRASGGFLTPHRRRA